MSDVENHELNSDEVPVNDGELNATQTADSEDLGLDAQADEAINEDAENPELEEVKLELSKVKDAFLRAKAEEDNIRRRAEKEVANSRKFAVEGFAKEMLNVFDSLTLATQNQPSEDADETVKSIYEGSTITLTQLSSAFAKFAVKEITPEVGEKLNPNVHQAMSMVDSEEIESGHIITVIQSGFELHDRLLRPAMVVVAK